MTTQISNSEVKTVFVVHPSYDYECDSIHSTRESAQSRLLELIALETDEYKKACEDYNEPIEDWRLESIGKDYYIAEYTLENV